MNFENLNLIAPLLKALQSQGYEQPTPIQEQAIPVVLNGKNLLACAQTGTGKTAAFAIPILQILFEQKKSGNLQKGVQALVLTPTRELAVQIEQNFIDYGRHTGLRHVAVYGGVPQYSQVNALRRGVDILIATPGRLLDLVMNRHVSLNTIQLFVLDEADRMLDMGFINDVKKIVSKLPQQKQTLFFSATMPAEIASLSRSILVDPVKITISPEQPTAEKVEQTVYFVERNDKKLLLVHLLKNNNIDSALVFTQTKHGADRLCRDLIRENIRVQAIHGNKTQSQRQSALQNFKTKRTRVLVATDIASRGIDINNLKHVINYDLPNTPETYVHRIGRTGRGGAEGMAISFCGTDEKPYLRDIHKMISQQIPVVSEHPYPMDNPGLAYPPKSSSQQRGNFKGGSRSFKGSRKKVFMQGA